MHQNTIRNMHRYHVTPEPSLVSLREAVCAMMLASKFCVTSHHIHGFGAPAANSSAAALHC